MDGRKTRLPINQESFVDELRLLHEVTGKFQECYQIYTKYYDHLSERHRRGMETMIFSLYQDFQDYPLSPLPTTHLSGIVLDLQKALLWLYTVADTVEHRVVMLPPSDMERIFASMRTEPLIPVVHVEEKKGARNKRK